MSIFSKAKKLVKKVEQDIGLKDKPKRPAAAVDPDPINPLTGRPTSQDGSGQQTGMEPMQGIGQMPPAYLPQPVSMAQRVPQGLGSDVFRSTVAPLQQQGYGLGQVDPRFLQGIMQQRGGGNASIPFAQPGQPLPSAPVSVQSNMMFPGMAPPVVQPQTPMQQARPQGLGQRPFMGGGLGSRFNYNRFLQ